MMMDKPVKVTAVLKVTVTMEFYDPEATEETVRFCIEQDLEDSGHDAEVVLLKEQEHKQRFFVDSDGKIAPLSEQKHGHWNLIEDYDDDHWQCSCCGEEWYLEAGNPTDNEMYYCPHCGAKMNEEVKQDDEEDALC